MFAVPAIEPVKTPAASMVAFVLLDDHVPPLVASESEVVVPTHNSVDPVISAGSAFIVTFAVTMQPSADV